MGTNIIIPLTSTDDEPSMAEKIKDKILEETEGFEETRIDEDNNKIVIIEGEDNVESLSISSVEIPERTMR